MGIFKLKAASLVLSAVLLATSYTPSQAFSGIPVPVKAERTSDIELVRHRGERHRDRDRGYYRRGDRSYYNGHRGYRYYRPGYRQYNGIWFPLSAFAAGAIIGGAATADRPVRYGGSHVEWCSNRYRSYRAYDNTYQPYNGPRRQCNSPY